MNWEIKGYVFTTPPPWAKGRFRAPWDRGVRVGLGVTGPSGATASFDYFSATPGEHTLLTP
jgi:hypothetical protein